MPRVIVVDDHAVIRRGVQGILHAFPEWEVCAEAENAQEAILLAESLKPETILMCGSMLCLGVLQRIPYSLMPCAATTLLREGGPSEQRTWDYNFSGRAGYRRWLSPAFCASFRRGNSGVVDR